MTQHTRATKLRLSEVMKEDTAPVDFVGSVYTCPIHPEMSRTATDGIAMGVVAGAAILLLADGPPPGVAAIGAGAAIMAAVSSYCAWFGSRIDAWFDHFGGPENGTFFALSGVIRAIGGGLLYGWWIYGRGGGIGHAR